jgi:hypothetical protein
MGNSIWKVHIAFGLVAFPVKLHAAARSQAVSFNQLHQYGPPRRIIGSTSITVISFRVIVDPRHGATPKVLARVYFGRLRRTPRNLQRARNGGVCCL